MNAKWKLLLLSTVSGALLSLSGCAPECQDKFDCANKGANYTCSAGKCVQTSGSGGGSGSVGGGSGTSGGGTTTGGGDGTTGGGTATTGGGDGTTGGGTATTGGGDGTTGGGTATTGGGDGTTGGGTATTGGGTATTGGGTATTGGGTATTGGGTATTGGGTATTGGGTATTGGGTATTGGGTATTGGGTATTGGGTATTGGGTATTGGGTGTTGGGTAASCTTIGTNPFFLGDANGNRAYYDALITPDIGSAGVVDGLELEIWAPTSGTVDLGSATNLDYSLCEQCLVAYVDEGATTYFQSAGTLDVSSGDTLNGTMQATLTGVTLVEVDPNTFEPIDGGSCLSLPSAVIDVTTVVDAGVPDAGSGSADSQIAQVRADAVSGTTSTVTIQGAVITYVKPLVAASVLSDGGSNDPAGFFIQGSASGPGLFVALDPATLPGGPYAVGDLVDITVSTVGQNVGLHQITGITSIVRQSSGLSIAPTDASSASFFDTGVTDTFESKYVTLAGTVTGASGNSGTGYAGFPIATMGTTDGGTSNFVLRVPTTVRDALEPTQQFGAGCTFVVNGPVWRYTIGTTNRVQPSVWNQSEITIVSCPAPTVTSASAGSANTVNVLFSRYIDAGSVTASAFTIDNSVTVVDAGLTGAQQVTLQTSTLASGTTYTVTADSSVTDFRGAGVATPNSATFTYSAGACSPGDVVISAVYGGAGSASGTYTQDFVEIHNRGMTDATLNNWSIQYRSSGGTGAFTVKASLNNVTIPAGGYFLAAGALETGLAALPTAPDYTSSTAFQLSGSNGTVALASVATALASCGATGTVDLVGYGSSNCPETTATASLSATTAATRNTGGCSDTSNNSSDFTIGAVAAPRNSATTAQTCTCP